jgi:hypothetical protein
MLLENRYDLRLAESGLAHEGFLSAILAWKPTVSNGPVYRGNVDTSYRCNLCAAVEPTAKTIFRRK